MTTAAMAKAVCLPQHLFEDVIFKLREKTDLDVPEQNEIQLKLEGVLKSHFSHRFELVIADPPATINGSSHDANAVTTTPQDDPASPSLQRVSNENHKTCESSSDEEGDISPTTSKKSSPASSTEGSPPESPERLSSDPVTRDLNRMPKSDPSNHGNDASGLDALSNPTPDKTTPDLNAMTGASSSEVPSIATAQSKISSNDTPNSPAIEESIELHIADSSSASVHTEITLNDIPDSPGAEILPGTQPLEPRSISRPQSRASSTQSFYDLSFEEKWKIYWDAEDGGFSLGSQLVAAYASPVQDGNRTRTSCDSHEDPGRWRTDSEGFINEVGRAGGPRLTPLPFKNSRMAPNGDPANSVLKTWDCMLFFTSIMAKYNIQPDSMQIWLHDWYQDDRYHGCRTLTFEAHRDKVDNAWPDACREIFKFISKKAGMKPWEIVSVEIVDPELRFFPRAEWHPEFPDLPLDDLRSELLGAIDNTDIIKTKWVYLINAPEQDSELAFALCVNYRSDRDWRIPREQMVAVLDRNNFPQVGIFITKLKDWEDTHQVLF
ncbi:hypothetical protein N7452_005676 [Penicillium brevicompactum]|uniref:Uncharacterized protein n=1 Tax=Penicillium brevicompactum TaxID=5074 RepID=A0A9W9QPR9_PENBR|nr:hypothetical protein N7452_005676 [Penicillium brevicompactum]